VIQRQQVISFKDAILDILPKHSDSYDSTEVQSVSKQKDLGIVMTSDLSWTCQTASVSSSCFQLIGMLKRFFISFSEEQFQSIYKALIRPKIDYLASICSPSNEKEQDILEKIQRKATKLVRGFKNLDYNERYRLLRITSLKTRRTRGDLIEIYKLFNNLYDLDVSLFFKTRSEVLTRKSIVLRGHNYYISKPLSRLNIHQNSFLCRSIDIWNELPYNIVNALTLNSFKSKIDNWFLENKML